jgi:hypothetical protein
VSGRDGAVEPSEHRGLKGSFGLQIHLFQFTKLIKRTKCHV